MCKLLGRPFEEEMVLAVAQEIESSCGDLGEPPLQ